MLSRRVLEDVGPARCFTVNANIMTTKERVNGEQTLIGWVRAKDPINCPIGALAMYMVHLLDIQGFQLLYYIEQDLKSLLRLGPNNYISTWRQIYLLHGQNEFKPLPYSTHYNNVKSVFDAGKCWGYCRLTMTMLTSRPDINV